jgi:hypothetical protein
MAMSDQVANGLAIFSANYLKRWLEGNLYDRFFRTGLGQKLKGLDAKAHHGIEFGLNLLTVFFDRALADDTAMKRFVKEVGLDAAPEISKRLINNATNPQEQELVHALLAMGHEQLVQLLRLLYEIEPGSRKSMLKEIEKLSMDELLKLALMPSNEREKLMGLFVHQEKPWLSPEEVQAVGQATEKLKALRARLRQRSGRGQSRE